MSRRISIIGTINYDRIILADGHSYQGLGGILYNVLTLVPFLEAEDRLVPVARIGRERRREVERFLSAYSCIDSSCLLWAKEGTNETVLTYRSADEREEALIERVPPLTWEEIEPAADSDFIVSNLISGKELNPALLGKLCRKTDAPLILDTQSLTLTFEGGSGRGYRTVPKWKDWIAPAHTVKGNEREMRWMVGSGGKAFSGSMEELLQMLLDAGPSVALVTTGTAGHTVAWRENDCARCVSAPAASLPPESVDDTTGCGDGFTSGYLLGLLRGEDPLLASLLGASLAASVCTNRGLEPLKHLHDPAEGRESDYADLLGKIGKGWQGARL